MSGSNNHVGAAGVSKAEGLGHRLLRSQEGKALTRVNQRGAGAGATCPPMPGEERTGLIEAGQESQGQEPEELHPPANVPRPPQPILWGLTATCAHPRLWVLPPPCCASELTLLGLSSVLGTFLRFSPMVLKTTMEWVAYFT